MKTIESITDINQSIEQSNQFYHILGGYVIDLPCILTTKNRVFVHGYFDMVDFLDSGNLYVRSVKVIHAHLRDSFVKIIVLDLKSGKLIERVHWANDDEMVCNWMLLDPDMFEPESRKDELLQFEF